VLLTAGVLIGWRASNGQLQVQAQDKPAAQKPPAGFPASDAVQRLYGDADLNRAVQAYRFFYPTVSGAAIFKGNEAFGGVTNKVFWIIESKPHHVGFTYNSDTPYSFVTLDLSQGPWVVDLPAGPLIVVAFDMNQLWVADMGLPGPDEGKGGKHLLLPPGYKDKVPANCCKILISLIVLGDEVLSGVKHPLSGSHPAALGAERLLGSDPHLS
jgi:hypothetical protein